MKRQLTVPVTVVWVTAVVVTWVVTTAVLAPLIKATGDRASAAHLIGEAAVSATFACVIVGGPAAAVALRVRRRQSCRRAVLSGVATAALVLLFFWSYVAATGERVPWAWQALLPLVLVMTVELSLALWLRRRCRDETAPEQTPPGQAPPGRAEPA